MKNSIKYLFGLLITPLLCIGVSFGAWSDYSDYGYTKLNDINITSSDITNNDYVYSFNNTGIACLSINSISSYSEWATFNGNITLSNADSYSFEFLSIGNYKNNTNCGFKDLHFGYFPYTCDNSFNFNNNVYCFAVNENSIFQLVKNSNYISASFSVYFKSAVQNSCDCSNVENQLTTCLIKYNSLQSQYNTLSGNYQSCQSDLASCTNSCDTLVSQCQSDKETLQTNYSGCLESNSSLNIYNQSLSDQLNECLMTNGTGFDGSGNIVVYEYQLSWNDGFSDLYLPITNSIKLPYGYRGFLDEGVLAIKNLNTLESAYTIDNKDFEDNVIGSYGTIFLFFMSLGLFLIFVYAIRRYFIGLKSIK